MDLLLLTGLVDRRRSVHGGELEVPHQGGGKHRAQGQEAGPDPEGQMTSSQLRHRRVVPPQACWRPEQ